jgi:hypothetical protein
MRAAASSIRADVFDLVTGLLLPGLSGSGGGARSGSELSHLYDCKRRRGRSIVVVLT